MDWLQPLILPAIFLFWTVEGGRQLWKWHQAGTSNPIAEPTDSPNEEGDATSNPSLLPVVRGKPSGLIWLTIGLAGLICLQPSIGWLGDVEVVGEGSDPGLAELVEEECRDFTEGLCHASLNVAVVSGGNHALVSYGNRSLGGPPADTNTLYEIGSITKVFTGLALAEAMQRGLVELDQPVSELLSDGMGLSPEFDESLKVRHLATHTGGFPRLPPGTMGFGGYFRILFNQDPYAGYSVAKLEKDLAITKPESDPGKQMEYSNYSAGLLGYLLARKQGMSYRDMIRGAILEPLGMSNTVTEPNTLELPKLAQPYNNAFNLGPLSLGLEAPEWYFQDALVGAGGIRSDITDMLTFLQANMRPEDTAIGDQLRLAQAELFRPDEYRAIGMFWIHSSFAKGDTKYLWHNGGTGGFRTFIGFTSDGEHGVVLLNNTQQSMDNLGLKILLSLISRERK